MGTSLVAQLLRLRDSTAVGMVQFLIRELRSLMLQGKAKNKKKRKGRKEFMCNQNYDWNTFK